MAVLSRLLKVGSMTESLGIYVPAIILQKTIGLGRVLLFMYLMPVLEYGLWAAGVWFLEIATPFVTLGSNSGLVRYVGFYEASGRLREFYRRMRWAVPALCVVLTVILFTGGETVRKLAVASREGVAGASHHQQMLVCWVALGNVLLMAMYLNMLGFMYGLRVYRLASVVEIFFTVVFTILGVAVLIGARTGLALLLVHGGALAMTLAVGMVLLHVAVGRLSAPRVSQVRAAKPRSTVLLEPAAETDEVTTAVAVSSVPPGPTELGAFRSVFKCIIGFGLVALISNLLWNAVAYVGYRLVTYHYGPAVGGTYQAFTRLGQPVMFLANAAWVVIFTHVVSRWEFKQHAVAIFILETAYKAVAVVMMTLTIIIYATAPVWIRIIPDCHRWGVSLLGGLLMFFQVLVNLAIMTMLAKLREQPIVIALAALVGGAVSVLLAMDWMGRSNYGPEGVARAFGVGMYLGAGAVTVIYFLATRARLHMSTYIILAAPVVLLLPLWAMCPVWIAVLAAAVFTPLMFDTRQKRIIRSSVRRIVRQVRFAGSRSEAPRV